MKLFRNLITFELLKLKFPKGLQFTLWHEHKLPFCIHIDSIRVCLESQAEHSSNTVIQDCFANLKRCKDKDQYNSEIVT